MIESRISSKAQTTIPRAVRAALDVREGDRIAYRIDGDRVWISKAERRATDGDNPFATFTEWADELDAVYDHL